MRKITAAINAVRMMKRMDDLERKVVRLESTIDILETRLAAATVKI